MDFTPLQFDQVRRLFGYVRHSRPPSARSSTYRAFATVGLLNLPAFLTLRLIGAYARWKAASSFARWASSDTLTARYAGPILDWTELSDSIVQIRAKTDAVMYRDALLRRLVLTRHSLPSTWLTSAFVHEQTEHLVSNMFGLYSYAQVCARIPAMGPLQVMHITIGGAISGSLAVLAEWKLRNSSAIRAFGASSVVFSFLAVATLGRPNDSVQYGGLMTVPLWVVTAITVASQVYGVLEVDQAFARVLGVCTQQPLAKGKTAFSAHLGGAVFGALYWYFFLRPRRVRNIDAPGRVPPEEWASS